MKPENLLEAVKILSKNHSNEIVVNHVEEGGQVTANEENPTLHVYNCTASAVNNLKKAGFTLSMDQGLMCVDDYSKKS